LSETKLIEPGNSIMRQFSKLISPLLLLLLASRVSSDQTPGGVKERLDAVIKVQAVAHQRFLRDLEGKTTDEAQQPVIERYAAEVARNTSSVLNVVRDNPTDTAAVEALRFVIETAGRGPGDQAYRAMEILLREHARDPGMGDLCERLFHFWHVPAVAESLLRAVLEQHPNRRDRGLACYTLSSLLGMRAGMIHRIRRDPARMEIHVSGPFLEATGRLVKETDLEALEREHEALLERVIAEFPDIKDCFTPDRTIGAMAEGELFACRNLSEGKVAPEITGKDHEGKLFALSDYRGKVVVLTFTASWCGPCVAMYPQERDLAKRLRGKAFALLSVNADEDVKMLKKSITSGEITWRCWWDGGMDGPITTRWGVSAIPEIFVLDGTGVIRRKDVRGAELEKVVDELIEEKLSDKANKR
jgi:thiol-disulfide isomerase/thioredoxin